MDSTRQTLHLAVCGLTLLLGACSLSRPAQAATYYVAGSSTNTEDCTAAQQATDNHPIKTIRKGIGCLRRAGDTLYIREGTYHESIDDRELKIPSGTDWNTPVTIASYPGETATLMGRVSIRDQVIQYVIFDRLTVDAGGSPNTTVQGHSALQLAKQSHLRFSNGELRHANDQLIEAGQGGDIQIINNKIHGAYVFHDPNPWPQCDNKGCTTSGYCFYFNAHDSVIEGNLIYDCTGYGIHQYWGGGRVVFNNIIRNNVFYNNYTDDGRRGSEGADLLLQSGGQTLVYNNIFYNSTAPKHQAAIITKNTQDQIYNNTIYNVHGIGIYLYPGSTGTTVRNNIIYRASATPILDQGSGTVLCPPEKPTCNVSEDPHFVMPDSDPRDFRLRPEAASPARQAGVPMAGLSYRGAAPDAGALFATGGAPTLPTPTTLQLLTLPR